MGLLKLCRFVPVLMLGALAGCGDGDSTKRGLDAGSDDAAAVDAAVEDATTEAGEADSGVDADVPPEECPTISFVAPIAGAKLTEANDKDQDSCRNGFQYDVSVATSATEGTAASLFAGTTLVGEAKVSGAVVKFANVQLAANGEASLRVQVGGSRCLASIPVEVVCSVPTCNLTKPALSPAHPKLNGVPVANGGDRVSNEGSPYQVAVEVATSVEDGQQVQLSIDDSDVLLSALARGGKATFPGVTLVPDGDHTLVATCRAKGGAVGTSARAMLGVDTSGPELTIASPANGAHYELVQSFEVCATSTSTDATNLPSESAPTGGKNLCGAIGAATPVCSPLSSDGVSSPIAGKGCIQVSCPGGPPFDVTVTLRDHAGNPSGNKVLSGITCRTNLPSVDIVSPGATIAGDRTTRILASSADQTRKDAQASMLGAQYTVVACTEVEGAQIQLTAGLAGGTLTNLGAAKTVVPASPSDNCPSAKPYVARFIDATLPESAETGSGELQTATRLVAVVTDASTAKGNSPPVDLWVDSLAPTLGPVAPSPLCGYIRQDTGDWTTEVRLSTSVLPVTLTNTRPDNTVQTRTATTYNAGLVASLGNFTFGIGDNTLSASVSEPSGNTASLPRPCKLTVGNQPVVTWVTPLAGGKLGVATDGDVVAPGWQGTLTVDTDIDPTGVTPTPTVQFSTQPGGALGAPVAVDANGVATLAGATIPEGASVQIIATTSDVPNRGVGTASITIPVDVASPSAITGLAGSVPADKRRQGVIRLNWTAPSDNGQPATGYQVRVSTAPIDGTNFDTAENIAYVGAPAQPGASDSIDIPNRYIERDYYFAIAAQDSAGNRGPIASGGPARATFSRAILKGLDGTNEGFGRSIDGSESLNGDAFADLVVGAGTGHKVYIYFGAASGWPETGLAPSVVISGPSSFGYSAQVIGDIDSDGLPDLAVAAPEGGAGTVYIFKGRASWAAALGIADANYVITADIGATPSLNGAFLGSSFARLGDFDGDQVDDFAVAGYKYNQNQGYFAVVRGVPSGQTFPATVNLGANSPRTIEAAGPSGSQGRLGWAMTSLGAFYGTTGVLVVSGHFYGDTATEAHRYGAAFAFRGTVNFATPADSLSGANNALYLGWSIAPLGALGSPNAVAVASPAYAADSPAGGGSLSIHRGNTTTGPFVADPIVITNNAAQGVGDAFGSVFGSVIAGVPTSTVDNKSSFLGNSLPDVAVASLAEGGRQPKLYLIDGQKVATTLQSGDISTIADATMVLPSSFDLGVGVMPRSGAIRDLNNDGYADFAVAQYLRTASYTGEVVVFW